MILGPHALLGNNPRSIEYNVEWITDLIKYMGEKGFTRAEATEDECRSWGAVNKKDLQKDLQTLG